MLIKKLNSLLNKVTSIFVGNYNEKTFLPFFRIMVSVIAIVDLVSMLPDISLLFSNSKTIVPQELLYLQSEYFGILQSFYGYIFRNHFETFYYTAVLWVYIGSLTFLIIGLFSRFAAVIALILQLLIFKSFPELNFGYDNFITMSLFYCLIFPVGKYYSIDAKYLWKKQQATLFNYQRVLQIHLCMVYFFSGIAKALDPNWWNGNAIWRALTSIHNNYYSIKPIILCITGIGTVLLEILYSFLIQRKQTRIIAISLCILMHISIAVMLDLYSFAAIMIIWNIASFSKLTSENKTINEIIA